MKTGLILFAHGSTAEPANEAVRRITADVAWQGGVELAETAFLESGDPDLSGAVGRLLARGAGRIVVVPYFLTPGMHLRRDLPRLVEEARQAHGNPDINVAPPLDGHPALVSIVLDRFRSAGRS
ncbi:MAG: CbiX/SirB N-terminal domain-containing protein [Bryobacterales bacterium]|nr:CbiX/SirB N-terminal domain-containing protein [Bryobacterales bacterium]